MTTKEASLKWCMSIDKVRAQLSKGEIPGAEKVNGVWVIPDDAHPLTDEEVEAREEQKREQAKLIEEQKREQEKKNIKNTIITSTAVGILFGIFSAIAINNDATTFGIILMLISSVFLAMAGYCLFPKVSFTTQAIIIFVILFLFSCFTVYEPSRKSSSKKSYAEQYGYSVEDFYYQGSDGLWYKK